VNLVALAISCGAIAWVAAREQILSLRPDMPLLREQLGFGTRTVFGAIAERLQFRADAFLLNVFIGPVATGVYSVASGLAETLWYVPNALGIVVFSRAATGKVESDRIASTMSRLTFAFAVLLAVPVFLLAPLAVEIAYGPAFRDAGFALRFQLPGVIAYSVVAVLSQHIIARGAPGLYTIVLGLGLAANLVANVLLIPRFGLYGAATASSISYAFTALLTLVVFRRMSGLRIRDAVIVRRDDIVFARDALVAFRARRARGRMA
jgi:O-antigen/teichoic acid export membrane protein